MNIKLLSTMGLVSVIALSSCSEMQSTASEDGNVTLTGTAATGYALAAKEVIVEDADGEEIAEGVTDEEGNFAFGLKPEKADLPLLVKVKGEGAEEFAAIVTDEDGIAEDGEELFTQVTPLTDLAARRALGDSLRAERRALKKEVLDSLHEEIVETLIGAGLDPEVFFSKPFHPAVKNDTGVVADIVDMILHTLRERAEEAGLPIREHIAGECDREARLMDQDSTFQRQLLENMKEMGSPDQQGEFQHIYQEKPPVECEENEAEEVVCDFPKMEPKPLPECFEDEADNEICPERPEHEASQDLKDGTKEQTGENAPAEEQAEDDLIA